MIHEELKCIFIHITKTAGCSITETLGKNDGGNPHRNIFDYINEIGSDKIKDYFTFAFVRNPWDRMVSEYNYQIQRTDGKHIEMSFEEYLNSGHINQIGNQLDWIAYPRWEWNNEKREYINKLPIEKILIDFIGKYENLEENMNLIFEKYNINKIRLPHLNKSNREDDYKKYYNDKTKKLVEELHERDIDYFKYKF